jgi:hypothetical protein
MIRKSESLHSPLAGGSMGDQQRYCASFTAGSLKHITGESSSSRIRRPHCKALVAVCAAVKAEKMVSIREQARKFEFQV